MKPQTFTSSSLSCSVFCSEPSPVQPNHRSAGMPIPLDPGSGLLLKSSEAFGGALIPCTEYDSADVLVKHDDHSFSSPLADLCVSVIFPCWHI